MYYNLLCWRSSFFCFRALVLVPISAMLACFSSSSLFLISFRFDRLSIFRRNHSARLCLSIHRRLQLAKCIGILKRKLSELTTIRFQGAPKQLLIILVAAGIVFVVVFVAVVVVVVIHYMSAVPFHTLDETKISSAAWKVSLVINIIPSI